MKEKTKKSISASLEAEENLLPYMPYLLQDLWALGSSVDQILELTGSLGLSPENSSILDLGCGKGAVSVQIASRFKIKVVGIDAMKEFLAEARSRALDFKVSHLCKFTRADIRDYVLDTHGYDLVILASLGGIFGTLKETVLFLRTQVKPGGYIIIDDGYLRKAQFLGRKGYEHYRNHEETLKELEEAGERILTEINTTAFSKKINEEYLNLVRDRSKELIKKNPKLEKDLEKYIELQAEECDILNEELEGALWLLKRKDTPLNLKY